MLSQLGHIGSEFAITIECRKEFHSVVLVELLRGISICDHLEVDLDSLCFCLSAGKPVFLLPGCSGDMGAHLARSQEVYIEIDLLDRWQFYLRSKLISNEALLYNLDVLLS